MTTDRPPWDARDWDQLPGDGELAWLGAIIMVLSAGCSAWLYYRAIRFVLEAMR